MRGGAAAARGRRPRLALEQWRGHHAIGPTFFRVQGTTVRVYWRATRAACRFPAAVRRRAMAMAWRAARGYGETCRVLGEPVAGRRCLIRSTDDVALEGWVALNGGLICAECNVASLGGRLAYGRAAVAFRGRVGSPRRSLASAYQAIVAFKERRGDWVSWATPLAHSLALSVTRLMAADGAASGDRHLVVPVPSYRDRRPHMHMLTALACIRLPTATPCFGLLAKTMDFAEKELARTARRDASQGAYAVRGLWRPVLRGRRVIVTDDLLTTGATLNACAAVLREAGAAAVDGAAILRVVRTPPERFLSLGARQVRVQLRELDGRYRMAVAAEPGLLWVQFGCSTRCPRTPTAGPFPLPGLNAVTHHRWSCPCGASHVVRLRREWRDAKREAVAVEVGERTAPELIVGVVQGPPPFVH